MTRLRPEPRLLPLALALFVLAAQAQQGEGGGSGAGGIQPRLGVSQTWTDNLRLAERDKDAALITTISPGISISRNAGSLRGSLDYSLNGITYVKTTYGSRVQNALAATVQADIVPGTFSVDVQANIGQQNASAFGLQSGPSLGTQGSVSALDNPNSRETGVLNVSPLLRGQIGSLASFDLRGNFSMTEVRGSALGDSRTSGGSLRISQLRPGMLSWYALALTQQTRAKLAQSNRTSSVVAGLQYRPDADWLFSANIGQEKSNYLNRTDGGDSGTTSGLTADWSPTTRTRVSGNYQRHTFGNSRGATFEHRMRNSVWRLSDTRSVTLGNTGSISGLRTNYDL